MADVIETAYKNACLAELQALKPGNVHIFAAGHDMDVVHFIKSAEVSAPAICQPEATVGDRIWQAINATNQAVGMNTNLGIVLLCAPLIHAYQSLPDHQAIDLEKLHLALKNTLQSLTVTDGQTASRAIVLAAPAGLGEKSELDVNDAPQVTLLELMQYAQQDDQVAYQYANDYDQIFDAFLPVYEQGLLQWEESAWATSVLYLHLLSSQPDSHLIRKYGIGKANVVMAEAKQIMQQLDESGHPKRIKKLMLEWDKSLKERRFNPGTTADLTVCTILVKSLMLL